MSQDTKSSATADDTANESAETPTKSVARLRWIGLFVLLAVTIGGVLIYWRYAEIYPSTDNAYTGADIVRIAPLVAGPVVDVYVMDDQKVSKGAPLFAIEAAPYNAALRVARAQFDAAANATGTEGEHLAAAAKDMEAKRTALVDAYAAYGAAEDSGKPDDAAVLEALKKVRAAQSAYDSAHAAFSKAQDKPMIVTTPTAKLRGAAAQLDKATEDSVKTYVVAPKDGWVSNVRLRPGAVLNAGTPAFALVEAGNWWVDANFKETDLARIHDGQPATIKLDMYPGYTIDGTVESISAGSGALFSILPPENATGNWVKVTQRFPVRIKIDSKDDPRRPLRVGATATVRIDTTGEASSGARAEAGPAQDASANAAK